MNPLRQLQALGQSVWLDDLRRQYLDDGTLARLIREDGLSGITSNPAIFERAINEGGYYDEAIKSCARNGDDAATIYQRLVIADIQRAADLLGHTWRQTDTADGYVSLEVSPHLANDTEATIHEALQLWSAVDRPNVMIKVPGTGAGLPAIETLIAEGVNVNVTLLFSPERYRNVVDAYWKGLEKRIDGGQSLRGIVSVASFFLSRIDVFVDRIIDQRATNSPARGCAALTAAALAYQYYLDLYRGRRWFALAQAGARPQRLLWASTGTKNPAYSDIKYVEELVAANTVSTMPMNTLLAYRDHGKPERRIASALAGTEQMQQILQTVGIDLEVVAGQLELEGIRKFVEPFDKLMKRIEEKRRHVLGEG